ncbi:uncharacterized protein LOC122853520 [Aphidius gifuensis]|uniref:uncharacterized protein LOC122853520 n=1 Tax=Aphidius gifuensis TaxID=684658 RepID=UPI001CDD4BF7|nr:uncharacterized protein LOC122853520 [Aphidius gifuensis]
MKLINLIFIVVSINLISYEVSTTAIGDVEEVYTLFMNIWTRVDEGIKEANTGEKPKYQATPFGDKTSSMLEAMIDKVDEISVQLEAINNRVMEKLQELQDDIKAIPDKVLKDQLLTQLSHLVKSIKTSYKEVKKLGNKRITKGKARFIIDNFDERTTKERCDKRNSPQQFIYQLYLTLISTEIIGYSALAYGFGVNELLNPDEKADIEIETVIDDIVDRIYRYSLAFSKAIPKLSSHFRTCDNPGTHKRDVTFTEFSGLYQKVLLSEYTMRHNDSLLCENWCEYSESANSRCYGRPSPRSNLITEPERSTPWINQVPKNIWSCTTNLNCAGKIHSCRSMKAVRYCMDKNYTHRRYKYIGNTENNDRWGQWTSDCEVYDYWDSIKVTRFDYCLYCLCTCDDDTWKAPFAVNVVSLLPSRSNTSNNMVVTGMRIKVHDKILHIQVKQGEIIDNYHILPHKLRKNTQKGMKAKRVENWIRLPSMHEDVRNARRYNSSQNLREDVDFVAWHWNDNAFNLDEVSIPPGRVLTGVKFGLITLKEGNKKKRIQVEAESMEYDHTTGKLIQNTELWTKPELKNHDTELYFEKDLPINSDQPTILDSQTNQYVIPSISDEWKDAGQSVLPFFDAQTVGCRPEAPLGGIGFHHRGAAKESEDSGFLGLTAHTVDYSSYLRTSAEKYAEMRGLKDDDQEDKNNKQGDDDYDQSHDDAYVLYNDD